MNLLIMLLLHIMLVETLPPEMRPSGQDLKLPLQLLHLSPVLLLEAHGQQVMRHVGLLAILLIFLVDCIIMAIYLVHSSELGQMLDYITIG